MSDVYFFSLCMFRVFRKIRPDGLPHVCGGEAFDTHTFITHSQKALLKQDTHTHCTTRAAPRPSQIIALDV